MIFQLFTRPNSTLGHTFSLYNMSKEFSTFNASNPVKLVVHGWKGTPTSSVLTVIKNAYLLENDVNVITLSWGKMASKNYFIARSYVPKVGQVAALLIRDLIKTFRLDLNQIHIIGHSLGGHIAGIAGFLLTDNGLQIGRVTGLDPAGFMFFGGTESRIKKNSAAFVDVIHTAKPFYGFGGTLGHVDFYPNGGGPFQPMTSLDITTIKSHRRAFWLFAESITTPGGFLAVSCPSWKAFKTGECSGNDVTEMGEYASTSARGTYYLTTNKETPFSRGAFSIYKL